MTLTHEEKEYWTQFIFDKEEEELEIEIKKLSPGKQEEVNQYLFNLFLVGGNKSTETNKD